MDIKSAALLEYADKLEATLKSISVSNPDMSIWYYLEHYKDEDFDENAWNNKFSKYMFIVQRINTEITKTRLEAMDGVYNELRESFDEYKDKVNNNRHED